MTQAIVGKIYKIKKGSENKCGVYSRTFGATKIAVTAIDKIIHYRILSEENWVLDNCWGCFTESDLEEIEKTLNNLEIGDVVVGVSGNMQTILSVLPSAPDNPIYVLSKSGDQLASHAFYSAHELEKYGYTIISTPPTPKKTVDDVLAQLSEEDKEIVKNALK